MQEGTGDAGVKSSDTNEIILVGGMTCIPKVVEAGKGILSHEPSKGVKPDEAALQSVIPFRVASLLGMSPIFFSSMSLPYALSLGMSSHLMVSSLG